MNHALGRIFSDAKHHSHRGCRFLQHGAGSQPAASLRRSGKLQVNAGRIDSVIAAGEQLRVSWRPRGGGSATLTVDLVVNATGPDYDRRVESAARSRQPL
jgi:uncharacterized NAD(P)/FAD-binding protein YdhS